MAGDKMEPPLRETVYRVGGCSAPPGEGRVKRSLFSLPVIDTDRLRTAKTLVEKAAKSRKVFSVQGPYPVIRAGLRARGWVERRLPRPVPQTKHFHGEDEDDGDDEDDSDDNDNYDDSPEEVEQQGKLEDLYDLMSRLVRNETTYFYWTTRRDTIDCHSLRKEQMINHFAKAGSFTTKVGLCVNLRNLHWFDTADPDTFFPRCYRLGAEDEKHAFIEDFQRTACCSLLKCIVERTHRENKEGEGPKPTEPKASQSLSEKKQHKRRATQLVGPGIIDNALIVCQEFLDSLEHHDIDVTRKTSSSLTEQQWAEFLHNYYLVVHDGVLIEQSARYVDRCEAMLQKLQRVCPQLEMDGIHNIWIVKPGAMSRGILCLKTLDDIQKLVDSDPVLIKDSKWVIQKYLERPLLIYETKFDLRQWFLVTDWNPLTVWFYNKCYLRFSTQPYSLETLDSSVHLCNNSIQKHFQPSQERHPEVPKSNMWSSEQFQSFLCKEGRGALWGSVVVPGMQQAVVHALQTVQDLVESRRNSFELYGADFMLGQDLRPWLIEINASPTMAPSTAVTARLCAAVQEDTLRVVLDRRCDRNADTGGFQLIYKQPAVEVPQYVGVNLLVEGEPLRQPHRRPPPQRRFTVHLELPSTSQVPTERSGQIACVRVEQAAVKMGKTTKKPVGPQPSNCKIPVVPRHRSPGKENQTESQRKGPVPAQTSTRGRYIPMVGQQLLCSPVRSPPKDTTECCTLGTEPKKPRRQGISNTHTLHAPLYRPSHFLDSNRNPCCELIPPTTRLVQSTHASSLRAAHGPHSFGPVLPLEIISLQPDYPSRAHTVSHNTHSSHLSLHVHQLVPLKQFMPSYKEGSGQKYS